MPATILKISGATLTAKGLVDVNNFALVSVDVVGENKGVESSTES